MESNTGKMFQDLTITMFRESNEHSITPKPCELQSRKGIRTLFSVKSPGTFDFTDINNSQLDVSWPKRVKTGQETAAAARAEDDIVFLRAAPDTRLTVMATCSSHLTVST